LDEMNLDIFKDMDRDDLLRYIEFLLWHYRVMDSFWFIRVEEEFGIKTAERINERVWVRVTPMAVKDLLRRFNIEEKGLEGLVKALSLFPWTIIGGHKIEKVDNEVILTVSQCPPQVARLKRGLGEYDCKEMHMKEFIGIAREVDPHIQVRCEFAPPDPHPEDLFCKWRFTV